MSDRISEWGDKGPDKDDNPKWDDPDLWSPESLIADDIGHESIADVGGGADLPDKPVPPDVRERADLVFDQTQNAHGWENTCAPASVTQVVQDHGGDVTFDQVLDKAVQDGKFHVDSGIDSIGDVSSMLKDHGVDAHVQQLDIDQLAERLEDGHGVIAAVNQDVMYGHPPTEDSVNHAIFITGVERSQPGGPPTTFYANETGVPGGKVVAVPAERMGDSFEFYGGGAAVTDQPKERRS